MVRKAKCATAVSVLLAVGTFGPGVWLSGAASAQTVTPEGSVVYPPCNREASPDDVEGAKGAHKAASQFFERGDYDRAIQYWNDAYGFDCSKPALLLNIANAYEKKGDKRATISILETYLERAPDSPDAATIRAKVDNLRANLEPLPPPVPTGEATAEPTATADPAPPAPLERPFGVAPWVVAGAGVAMAVPGVILFIVGQGKISDAEAVCPDPSNCTGPGSEAAIELGNDGNDLSLIGSILGWGGLGVVAVGLVWQLAFNAPQPVEQAASLQILPAAVPGPHGTQAGVVVQGTF
jgi:tetratricopeptide (TPR) repeat protein